jgi:hypothetical protein
VAVRSLRAVAVDASGRGGARERGYCGGAVCVARGGSTEATVSGGATVAAQTEEKKNESPSVSRIYRAMQMTSQRRVASHECAGARAGDRGHAWKAFEAH